MPIDPAILSSTVDTRDDLSVVTDAIDLLSSLLPDWIARNGAPEVIYLEAVAQLVTAINADANAMVGSVVESILADLYGVPRLPGAVATGEVTVTFDGTVTLTIPAGTRFTLPDFSVDVESTADVNVSAASTADVPVATTTSTGLVNGAGATATLHLLDAVPYVTAVAISTALSGGADPEDDTAYLLRAQTRLSRVTSSLVVPDHFAAYVLEDGRASNAVGIGAWDGTGGAGGMGTDGGHVTVATYGRGAQLSAPVKAELAAAMQAITAAGVTVHVQDSQVTTQNVTATVKGLAGYDPAQVEADCEAAVAAWLAPETWTFGDTIRTTVLTTILADVTGVDYVVSITTPSGDVTLDADEVADAGTVAVTVT